MNKYNGKFRGTLRGAFLIPKTRTISSVVEHSPPKRDVVGSIPAWSIKTSQADYKNIATNNIVTIDCNDRWYFCTHLATDYRTLEGVNHANLQEMFPLRSKASGRNKM